MAFWKILCRTFNSRNSLFGYLMVLLTLAVSTYLLLAGTYAKIKIEVKDVFRHDPYQQKDDKLPYPTSTTNLKLLKENKSKFQILVSTLIPTKTGLVPKSENRKTETEKQYKSQNSNENRDQIPKTQKRQPHISNEERPDCVDYKIHPKVPIKSDRISCVGHMPSNEACRFAKELYYRDDNLKSCGYARKVEICKLSETIKARKKSLYQCSFEDCIRYKRNNVTLWAAVNRGDSIESQGVYHEVTSLQLAVAKEAKRSRKQGTNFLFLECSDMKLDRPKYDVISQFLLLSPTELHTPKENTKKKPSNDNLININIVLIDSAARAHFYRSLPTVIDTFNDINKNSEVPAEVLDYELFQSIEGHTAENLHALFTGKLFPKHWTGSDRESVAIGAGDLFNRYRRAGYRTFYQDDLCYSDWWGIRMDMGSARSWDAFQKRLADNGIDNAGLTFASCRILNHNNVSNPFAGPEGPLCFNGRFQDSYYLEYAASRHHYASRKQIPLLSFTALNVAHDHTGRRIQSIDYDMAKFVKQVSSAKNTITFLMADHGNTYARYTHAIMEGRFEQFHPTLFVVLPDHVKKILGEKVVNNLRQNQKKLITMLDIHKAIVGIPNNVPSPEGIFGSISSNRTCDDLDLRLPNLCVCEGWDAETLNDSRHVGIVNFAVGSLNNKILSYQQKIRQQQQIPTCQRLVPTSFTNIRERNHGKELITSLDFHTNVGHGADHDVDIFHVEIKSSIDPKLTSFNLQLLNFDRVSKYGPYRVCGDKEIDMRLCVCDMKRVQNSMSIQKFVLSELSPAGSLLAPSNVDIEHKYKTSTCLYFKTLAIPELSEANSIFSKSYEVANVCSESLTIQVKVSLDNMKSSGVNPLTINVAAYGVTYIGEMIRNVPYWNSIVDSLEYSISGTFSPPKK